MTDTGSLESIHETKMPRHRGWCKTLSHWEVAEGFGLPLTVVLVDIWARYPPIDIYQ